MSAKWEVREGDCVERLAALAENSVDAIVTDPPYGLEFMGKEWDRLEPNVGKASHPGFSDGSFKGFVLAPYNASANVKCEACGRWKWDWPGRKCECESPRFPNVKGSQAASMQAWHLRWATAAFRVLKPGGHLLAFGGTRTFHRLASAIEDAGFEIRDTIHWAYGNGFPKSHNLEGEWDGWGTALKPAHEPIVVARKPLAGTAAENVAKWGTGAVNVAASRVGYASGDDHRFFDGETWKPSVGGNVYGNGDGIPPLERPAATAGRWPPNLLLTHSAACERRGTRSVADGYWTYDQGAEVKRGSFIYEGGWASNRVAPADARRKEQSVEAWSCTPGCPVAELDRQSGASVSSKYIRDYGTYETEPTAYSFGSRSGTHRPDQSYADAGTASRFFPQFGWDAEREEASFRYEPKASRAEREAGCEGIAEVSFGQSGGAQQALAEGQEEYIQEGNIGLNRIKKVRNDHPTVKPIALFRWLARLVTPPGGLVLDPFAGSGTTLRVARRLRRRSIGVELSVESAEFAREKVARPDVAWLSGFAEPGQATPASDPKEVSAK